MIDMQELHIGHHIAKVPIIQGGMGIGVSLSGLASAVANQGGIGVISAACIGFREPDFYTNFLEANVRALRKEIRSARAQSKGIIGVNIMVAMANFADMVKHPLKRESILFFPEQGFHSTCRSFCMTRAILSWSPLYPQQEPPKQSQKNGSKNIIMRPMQSLWRGPWQADTSVSCRIKLKTRNTP